jgi:hypothetical protein
VLLSVQGSDSYDHPLSYAWQASCPSLSNAGAFAPSSLVAAPTWTAPPNLTGANQTCTISVAVSDGLGHGASASYAQIVGTVPHSLAITSGPSATPTLVNPGGTVLLRMTTEDSLQHALVYQWQASCSNMTGQGTFKPSTALAQPVWVAPANLTGVDQSCTIGVTVQDGNGGLVRNGSVIVQLKPTPHQLTVSSLSAWPEPIASGATSFLQVNWLDNYAHAVSFAWQVSCPSLPTPGALSSASIHNPSWAASVTVSDAFGGNTTASSELHVRPLPDEVLITTAATGGPAPVGSGGPVVLHFGAMDTFGHPLSFAWQAVCPVPTDTGAFFPNASHMTPVWMAPLNHTGRDFVCTLTVTATDGLGHTVTSSYQHTITPEPDYVNITAGPTGSPNPVTPGGTVTFVVNAVDALNHPLTYAWAVTCPGLSSSGSFTPSAAVAAPVWTAPANTTGSIQSCTVRVTISDGLGQTTTGSYEQKIGLSADTVAITAGPTLSPDPVASGGVVTIALTASDSHGHPLSYAWTAVCPGSSGNGQFSSAATATPSWTAPTNLTPAQQQCTLQVTVSDDHGHSATADRAIRVEPAADSISIVTAPTGTPNPVASGGTVTLEFASTDALGNALTTTWQASCPELADNGTFNPSASIATPTWTAPINLTGAQKTCLLSVTASNGHGQTQTAVHVQKVDSANTITFSGTPGAADNPVASHGTTALHADATNLLNRPLSFAWSASCPALSSNGTFSDPTVAAPTWTAPLNDTGVSQMCVLQVTVTDGAGTNATGTFNVIVQPKNTLTVTQAAAGTPNPVPSQGTVAVSVVVSDVLALPLS